MLGWGQRVATRTGVESSSGLYVSYSNNNGYGNLQKHMQQWRDGGKSSNILRGTGTKEMGLWALLLEKSSVLEHLFTAYGTFCYYTLDFAFHFFISSLLFFLPRNLGG